MNWFQSAAFKAFSSVFRLREATLPYSTSRSDLVDDPDNVGWTPLTVGQRELPVYQQDKMFQIAAHLYRRNAIAHRIIEVIKAFVVGEGIVIQAKDPEVDQIIRKFWKDRRNNFRRYLRPRVVSLSLYGESLWPAYVNEVDGSVILGSSYPGIIKDVIPNYRNNFEAEIVKTKEGRDAKNEVVPEQDLEVIKVNGDPGDASFLKYDGEVFFYTINSPMDNLRGLSDLYSIADWLDVYDQFMFNRAERQAYMNTFLWDITLQGATQAEIDRKLATMILREKKQRSGRLYIHNEKEARQAISPDMRADDATRDAEAFMQMIMGGTGLSSQAFGDPGGGGRTASGDVNEWVFKTLSDRQFTFRDILLDMFDFVLDQAELHGELKGKHDRVMSIFMPKISIRDLQRLTQALRNVGNFTNQVMKTGNLLKFNEREIRRLRDVAHTLLDHVDQASGVEMLQDIASGEGIEIDLGKARHLNGAAPSGDLPVDGKQDVKEPR